MTPKERTLAAIKICQQATGPAQVIMRPMAKNVPDPPDDWTETECPRCGAKCYKMPQEPDVLPPGVTAACSLCAIKAGINRTG